MLNDLLRAKLKQILAEDRRDGMFGDGLEMDYIMDGCVIVGLNEMNDEELVKEYEEYNDEDDEFLLELKTELETHKLLIAK